MIRRTETQWEQIEEAKVRVRWTNRRPAESMEAEMNDEPKRSVRRPK